MVYFPERVKVSMHKEQQQVKEMMIALDLPLPHKDKPGVKYLTSLHIDLLRSLVAEEHQEFQEAMYRLDGAMQEEIVIADTTRNGITSWAETDTVKEAWVEVIDAMCDMIVAIHNTSNVMNLDLELFFDEVHRTNMLKGGDVFNEKGKRLKPIGWKPPKLREILEEMLSNRLDGRDDNE